PAERGRWSAPWNTLGFADFTGVFTGQVSLRNRKKVFIPVKTVRPKNSLKDQQSIPTHVTNQRQIAGNGQIL
ncbi:MAG: hypothetical protein LBQ44_05005, partial [Treponema sp.]|nr:hypothetical protein [Treponema sp.]